MNVTMKRVCPTCAWIAMDTLQLKNSTLIKLTAKVYLIRCSVCSKLLVWVGGGRGGNNYPRS